MHFSKKIKGLYIIIVTSTTIKSFQGEKQKKKKKGKTKTKNVYIYIYVNVFFKRKNHKLQRSFFFNNY